MIAGAATDLSHLLILAGLVALYLRDRSRERDLEEILQELARLRRLLDAVRGGLRDR